MQKPRLYRRRPSIIEAMHLNFIDVDTLTHIAVWVGTSGGEVVRHPNGSMSIRAKGREIHPKHGEVIVRDATGRFHAYEPAVFQAMYTDLV